MVSDDVGSKLLRLLYFVGAAAICTKGINTWREYERKAALKAAEAPVEMIDGAAAASGAAATVQKS